jgi:serine/threonine protein kinase
MKYDYKCDIWSIGIIYYNLLTNGKNPWESEFQIFRKPLSLPQNASEWSKKLLKRML